MVSIDQHEFDRWIAAAADELLAAEHNAEGGFHNVAVLHAELCAQCALKALLHGVGAGDQAYGHGLLSLADRAESLAGLELDGERRARLADLAREYLPSRYPDALPEGTPRGHYSQSAAARALDTARRALDQARAAWRALQAVDRETPADGRDESHDDHGA